MVIEEQEETFWFVAEERECLSCDLSRGRGMAGPRTPIHSAGSGDVSGEV